MCPVAEALFCKNGHLLGEWLGDPYFEKPDIYDYCGSTEIATAYGWVRYVLDDPGTNDDHNWNAVLPNQLDTRATFPVYDVRQLFELQNISKPQKLEAESA